jgi:hypothetical protein
MVCQRNAAYANTATHFQNYSKRNDKETTMLSIPLPNAAHEQN